MTLAATFQIVSACLDVVIITVVGYVLWMIFRPYPEGKRASPFAEASSKSR